MAVLLRRDARAFLDPVWVAALPALCSALRPLLLAGVGGCPCLGVRPSLASGGGSRGGAAPKWRKLGGPPVPSLAAAAVRCSSAQVPPPRGTSRREIESHPPAGDRGDGERKKEERLT